MAVLLLYKESFSFVPTQTFHISQHARGSPTRYELLQAGAQEAEFDDANEKNNENRIPNGNEMFDNSISQSESATRRAVIASLLAVTTSTLLLPSQPQSAQALPVPFSSLFNSKYSLSIVQNTNSTNAASIRQPLREGLGSPLFSKELATESCLLKLLPVKRTVFRKLEKDLLYVSNLRNYEKRDEEGKEKVFEDRIFADIAERMKETLVYLDSKRSSLEPVFNQDDTTDMTIMKNIEGEGRVESLRREINNIMMGAIEMDSEKVFKGQKKGLRALAEVGESLVDRFPYDVPTEGKFSYLPRLLGRAKVTFTIARPTRKGSDRQMNILGNVTILADGYAAPITAGNFVDLSIRNFYTGLPVKLLKKRLGATPSLTMSEDSVVAYDIASTVDKITGEDGVVQQTFGRFQKKLTPEETQSSDESGNVVNAPGTLLTTMPILGAFNEGFYDPLTAKPRRIPLEIVQYDRLTSTAQLSYESGFTSTTSTSATESTAPERSGSSGGNGLKFSIKNAPLLSYDIPGLVGMNHPDKNLNGGSSEFFCLRNRDMSEERTSLLDCQYAPFGYVMEGLDIMDSLQGGDVITATYVNEWGSMNLIKVRGTSFANAMNREDDIEK